MSNEIISLLPAEGFVRLPVILKIFGLCKTTFYKGIREGRYPKPVKLGPRVSVWRVEDIRAVISTIAGCAAKQ